MNKTPIAAHVQLTEDELTGLRYGIIAAKATFIIHPNGTVALDTQNPFPLFKADEATDLGLMPSDLYPRRDPVFEIIVLGAAYSKTQQQEPHRLVELCVGPMIRQMNVFGDRWWETPEKISAPKPFTRIPLTYDYAFGGTCEAILDDHTILDVDDPLNKYGRGFDAQKKAEDLAAGLQAPDGFPQITYRRMLPNLESPDHLITQWSDEPEPYCWSTVPPDIGFRMIEAMHAFQRDGHPPELESAREMVYHRSHPDLIIDIPPPKSRVILKGMRPDNSVLEFELPSLKVIADYVIGDRTGSRELVPQLLMLLAEDERFYLVYRSAFTLQVTAEMERSFRLRLEDGWYQPSPA